MASSSLWPSMYQLIKRHPKAVAASVGLHVVLLTLLSLSLTSSEIPDQPEPQASTIKAVLVDANKIDDERKKREQAEQLKVQQALEQQKKIEEEKQRKAALKKQEAERKKQAELKRKQEVEKKRLAEAESKKKLEVERKRKEEEKRLAALEVEKQRKQEAEKKRLAEEAEKKRLAEQAEKKRLAEEAERQRREEEARQKRLAEEAEKRRLAEEAELKLRLAEEERRNAEHNRMLDSLRLQYVRMIEQKVESKWLRPSTVNSSQSCEVYVKQTALGDVISVNLQECSNDVAFKNSIERAVWAASPLPPPPNPEVFDNEIRFTFRPKS